MFLIKFINHSYRIGTKNEKIIGYIETESEAIKYCEEMNKEFGPKTDLLTMEYIYEEIPSIHAKKVNEFTLEADLSNWSIKEEQKVPMPKEVKSFINEIDMVCKKYNKSIGHEDYQGAFIVEEYNKENILWLSNCYLNY